MTSLTYKPGPVSRFNEGDKVQANWQGVYAGAQIGQSTAHVVYGLGDDVEYGGLTQGFVGGFVGYNWIVDKSIVVGIQGDINYKFGAGFKIDDRLRLTSDYDGSIRARVGYMMTARSLVYATGGLAFAKFKTPQSGAQERDFATCDQNGGPSGGLCQSEAAEDHIGGFRTGWTAGGGAEYAMDKNWSTRLEYRYTDYGTKTVTNASANDINYLSKLTENRVSFGFGYRFQGDAR